MAEKNFSYEWIDTPSRLEQIAGYLEQAEIIGVDLEADSMHHYFEKVCVLQIGAEWTSYIIDSLALRNLSALRPVLSNPRIRKVFHGADYDLRSLYRDFGIEVENLFDTHLAAKFLGLRETGLEALLRNRFQVELKKTHQKADWSQRPLPADLLEYAALDGRYLIPLARMLEKELERTGRLHWVEEECLFLSKVRFAPPGNHPLFMRVQGASRLDPRSLAVLEGLLKFREARAQKLDLPPFKVLRNETLLDLAIQKPSSLEKLEAANFLSGKQIEKYGTQLLNEIQRALAIPEEALPRYPPRERPDLPSSARKRVQALKAWRDRKAKSLGIEPGVLLNNALIQDLAIKDPQSVRELEDIPGFRKWRLLHFGPEILAAKKENPKAAGK